MGLFTIFPEVLFLSRGTQFILENNYGNKYNKRRNYKY